MQNSDHDLQDRPRPYRPRRWYDWLFLGFVAFGILLFVLTVVPDIAETPVGLVTGLVAAIVQIAVLAAVFRFALPQSLFPRENGDLLSALLWGGAAATGLAGIVNGFGTGSVIAPFSEELIKLSGVLLVLGFGGVAATPARGFVIGFLVGAGFEIVENFEYTVGPTEDGSVASESAPLATAMYRTLVGFGIHPMLVAISGAALAYALGGRGRWPRMLGILVLVITLHAAWDNAAVFGDAVAVVVMCLAYGTMVAVFVRTCRGLRGNLEGNHPPNISPA